MKSVLLIGMGRFGHHLCKNLVDLGNEVMIIDNDEKSVEDLAPIVTSVLIGDCTNPEILKSIGVRIYPDKDIAEKTAKRFSANNVFDYIELTHDYSVYEIPPLAKWAGKTILDSNIRRNHNISILGVKHPDGRVTMLPTADYMIDANDHLMILGSSENIEKLLKLL